jgi:hypothetical protein
MRKTVFSLAALAVLIIAGCKKDDDGDPTTNRIVGKWTPTSIKVDVYNKEKFTSKTSYSPVYSGDYWDFRKDGKVYRYETNPNEGPGYDPHDTLDYKWVNPNWIIDGEIYWEGALTKDSLVLYLKENTTTESWETTYIFKK